VDLELSGKVALVTASSRGIGRAVAERLATEGATVVISSRDPATEIPADLTDPAQAAALVPAVFERHGRLDVLVVNTPGPPIRPFLETSPADWDAAYELLLRPAVLLAHAAASHMAANGGGAIVFLTSTWVRQPSPGGVLSASLRSAVSALAKQMALELAPLGVRVNQVQPGATATQRMQDIVAAKASANGTSAEVEQAKVVHEIPLGRWAQPEEIADAVAFLASARSSFVAGSALAVDGGAVRAVL
jgi:3-oxoacyl-[acyl-carrier protein] reductase